MEAKCCIGAMSVYADRVLETLKEVLPALDPETRIFLLQKFCKMDTLYAQLLTSSTILQIRSDTQ